MHGSGNMASVHFKRHILIFDFHVVYIGSANLTGASIGMKSSSNRCNFEAVILTNYSTPMEAALSNSTVYGDGNTADHLASANTAPT